MWKAPQEVDGDGCALVGGELPGLGVLLGREQEQQRDHYTPKGNQKDEFRRVGAEKRAVKGV